MKPALRPALITTPRLVLEPLGVQHAAEMAGVLAGTALYRYIGGAAPTAEELAGRYAALTVGGPPDRRETWLNWIIRENGTAAGFVQATVSQEADGVTSYVAWVVGEAFQGRGAATEAVRAMLDWLRIHAPGPVAASIHPENGASAAVARKVGLTATGLIDEDGEERWDHGATRTH